jgi:hypothetical protein
MSRQHPSVKPWGNEFESRLLGSARRDAPGPAARGKLLVGLGALGAAASATGHAAAAATGGAATTTALKGLTTLSLVKWIGVIALTVGAAALTVATGRTERPKAAQVDEASPTRSMESSPALPRSPANAAIPPKAPAVVATAEENATSNQPGPETSHVEVVKAAPARSIKTATSQAPTSLAPSNGPALTSPVRAQVADLSEETALIDAARAALRGHEWAKAMARLDEYQTRFPQGTFAPEATALRVEALLPTDRAEAERLARSFLATAKTGPLADRVRELLNR